MGLDTLKITFNENVPLVPEVMTLKILDGAVSTDYSWEVVALRSAAFEMTEGVPTANVGEISAINFAAAFNLDLNGGGDYTVTQNINVVTIESVNSDISIVQATSLQDITFEIFSSSGLTRANVRSPYLVTAPIFDGVSTIEPENVEFKLYVWTGDISSDKPSTASYTYIKQPRFSGDNIIYLDFAQQVRDFINQTYNNDLSPNVVFASYEVTTTYNSGADTLFSSDTLLCFDGYNTHFDGVNPEITEDVLITNRYILEKDGETLQVPFYIGNDSYTVESRNGNSVIDMDNFSSINITNTNNVSFIAGLDSADVNNIRVVNDDTLDEFIIDVEVVEECVYTPIRCIFVNKFGTLQKFWFFKSNREDLQVTDESYKRNVLTESIVSNVPTLSYNASDHRNKRYNVQGNRAIELNTGYIDEDNNSVIQELLLSEDVWLDIDGVIKPVDNVTKSANFLTKRNDQLVRYALKFNFSYDEINNIR